MATIVEVLEKTKEVIERGWTQGASARNKNGQMVPALNRAAVCWCWMGAHQRAVDELNAWDVEEDVYCAAVLATPEYSLITFNDTPGRVKEDVIAAINRLIEARR